MWTVAMAVSRIHRKMAPSHSWVSLETDGKASFWSVCRCCQRVHKRLFSPPHNFLPHDTYGLKTTLYRDSSLLLAKPASLIELCTINPASLYPSLINILSSLRAAFSIRALTTHLHFFCAPVFVFFPFHYHTVRSSPWKLCKDSVHQKIPI